MISTHSVPPEGTGVHSDLFAYVCFALAGINVIVWLRNDLNGDAGDPVAEATTTERYERGSDGYETTQGYYTIFAVIFVILGIGSLLGLQL